MFWLCRKGAYEEWLLVWLLVGGGRALWCFMFIIILYAMYIYIYISVGLCSAFVK